ncbi:MAG: hypothetical protein K2W33_05635, partial [Burkholderiales bacterium]|nr:hypothetical protein [Burkholderiales bacterium]
MTDRPTASHLVIPFAYTGGDGEPPLAPLPPAAQLPNLRALLGAASPQRLFSVLPSSLTPPHEWALAHAQGLATACPPLDGTAGLHAARTPTGQAPVELPADRSLPWAAWDAPHLLPTPQTPAAWFTPCHQEIGAHHVSLMPPASLGLSDAHSQALMAALARFAVEDGVHLRWVAADRWLATGNVLAGVQAASLDRVAGRSIGPWLHALPPMLRRLQSEAQMLFYTHAAHDERVAKGLPPVNAFWVSGAGSAPATPRPRLPESPSPSDTAQVTVVPTLRDAALAGDATSWQRAWTDVDQRVLPAWLARAAEGKVVHVHLCGEQ